MLAASERWFSSGTQAGEFSAKKLVALSSRK